MEPFQVVMKEDRQIADRHRNVRKEDGCSKDCTTLGGWMKRRVEAVPLSMMEGCQKPSPRGIGEMEQRTRLRRETGHGEGGIMSQPLGGSGHLSVRMWESEKHRSWSMPFEGFRNHVATDGSWLGVSGSWSACGCSAVQLDHEDANAWDVRNIGC